MAGGEKLGRKFGVEFGPVIFSKSSREYYRCCSQGWFSSIFLSARKMCVCFFKGAPRCGPFPRQAGGGAAGCGQAGAGRPGGLVPAPQPPCPPGEGALGAGELGGPAHGGLAGGVSERGFHRKRKPRAPHHRGGAGGQPSGARPPRHRSLALACWGLGRRSCGTMSWRGLGLCWLPGLWAAGRA